MKGELFFSLWVRLHLPATRSLKKGNALKHLTWLDWNWIKLIKSYQRSRGLFWTVYATAAKSRLVPSEPLLTADPLAVVALFAKLVEEQRWSRVATGGKKQGHRDSRSNSSGPGSRSTILSVQCPTVLTTSIPGSGLPTRPSAAISPPVLVRLPVFCQQLCRDDLQEEGGQLPEGELGSSSIYEGLCPHLLCFTPPASRRKMKTLSSYSEQGMRDSSLRCCSCFRRSSYSPGWQVIMADSYESSCVTIVLICSVPRMHDPSSTSSTKHILFFALC